MKSKKQVEDKRKIPAPKTRGKSEYEGVYVIANTLTSETEINSDLKELLGGFDEPVYTTYYLSKKEPPTFIMHRTAPCLNPDIMFTKKEAKKLLSALQEMSPSGSWIFNASVQPAKEHFAKDFKFKWDNKKDTFKLYSTCVNIHFHKDKIISRKEAFLTAKSDLVTGIGLHRANIRILNTELKEKKKQIAQKKKQMLKDLVASEKYLKRFIAKWG